MDFDDYAFLICLILTSGLLISVLLKLSSDERIKKEIIKNSNEYVIFQECHEIQNKYYCK